MKHCENPHPERVRSNKPGGLRRLASPACRPTRLQHRVAGGRAYRRPELSRITLQVGVENAQFLEQITKQAQFKLIEVLKIVELEEAAVRRELVLIKLKADPSTRSRIIEIVQLFRGKTVDVQNDSLTIEATGSPDKLEALLEMLRPYGVREARPVRAGGAGPGQQVADRPGQDRQSPHLCTTTR